MNVHDHRSRFESRCKQDRFLAIDGFPDDREVVIALDQLTQNLPNGRMVIHEKNLYWLGMNGSLSSFSMLALPLVGISREV